MSVNRLTRAEMETIVRWDAETKQASVYTCDPIELRKLERLAAQFPDEYRLVREWTNPTAREYTAPARLIRFGKPATEAQKERGRRAMAARMAGKQEQSA